jgi:hypothetical protein
MRLSALSGFTAVFLLTSFTALTPLSISVAHAQSVPSAAQIQTQVQGEWSHFKAMLGPHVTTKGDVTVTKDGLAYTATVPDMLIALDDSSQLKLANVTLTASPSTSGNLNVKINLPSTLKRVAYGVENDVATLGQHTLNAVVKPNGQGWDVQSVTGSLKDFKFNHNTNVSIGTITIDGKPQKTNITTSNVVIDEQFGRKTSIERVSMIQDAPQNYTMRLSDVLGLFSNLMLRNSNQNIFQSWQGSAAGASMTIQNVTVVDKSSNKTVLTLAKGQTTNRITSAAQDMLSLQTIGTFEGININQLPVFADILPQRISFTTTTRNVPTKYFSMPRSTKLQQEALRQTLTQAGTQIQIDQSEINTASSLKATATGLLTAANTAPTYSTGDVQITVHNLPDALAKLQTKVVAGGKVSDTGPAMMAIMMLQGMGQTSPSKPGEALYNVRLTPEGKIMINNQDFSKLAGLLNMGNAARDAAPKTTPSQPQAETPQITPWKQK